MTFRCLPRLPLVIIFILLLIGCTYHSIKAEDPDEVEAAIPDIVRYLESQHAQLEISPNIYTKITNQDPGNELAEDVTFKINSRLNPNLFYPNKYRLYVLYDRKTHPADWLLLLPAFITLGTLFPIQEIPSTDITSAGVLINITSDASNLVKESYLNADKLYNFNDPRILGRFRFSSELKGYSSILIPSAWLAGSSPPYIKTTKIYEHLNQFGGFLYTKYATLVKGLRDILKQLNEKSIYKIE